VTVEPTPPAGEAAAEEAEAQGAREDELVFSTRLLHPMLRFFTERFSREELERLVESLGTTLEELEVPERWVSVRLVRRFNRAMVDSTGDPLITYKAGIGLADPKVLGPTFHVYRALVTPKLAYSRMPDFSSQVSKITNWEVKELADDHATLRFHVAEGHVDDPLFCLNRQGALGAVPLICGLPQPRIEHPACIHHGDAYCEYKLRWIAPSMVLRGLAIGTVLAVAIAVPGLLLGFLESTTLWVLGGLAGASALAWLLALRRQLGLVMADTRHQLVDMKDVLESKQQQYLELQLLGSVDQLTRTHLDVGTLVDTALKEITTTLGYDRAVFFQVDEQRGILGHTQAVGYSPQQRQMLETLDLQLKPRNTDPMLFANMVQQKGGTLVQDVEQFAGRLSEQNRTLVEQLGTRALLAVPVRTRSQTLGLLVVDQSSDKALGDRDLELMEQLAHRIGLALANARMVQSLQTTLLQNQKFTQYLARPVVEKIRQDPSAALRLGGERIWSAVLFSDIVGFTPWSEKLQPEQVVAFLNRYFRQMDKAIQQTEGILDKRMGDGMMVVFLQAKSSGGVQDDELWRRSSRGGGLVNRLTPPPGRPPAYRALLCAVKMQQAADELCKEEGFEHLEIRVGVACGELVAGNMGSSHRLEYTVIGDVVNVASRLETACPPGSIYATRDALTMAGRGFEVQDRGPLQVKGRSEPVDTVEILGRQ